MFQDFYEYSDPDCEVKLRSYRGHSAEPLNRIPISLLCCHYSKTEEKGVQGFRHYEKSQLHQILYLLKTIMKYIFC